MSANICVVISKTKKGKIVISEAYLESEWKEEPIGTYDTAEEALGVLEDIMEIEGNYWEGVIIQGFKKEGVKKNDRKNN